MLMKLILISLLLRVYVVRMQVLAWLLACSCINVRELTWAIPAAFFVRPVVDFFGAILDYYLVDQRLSCIRAEWNGQASCVIERREIEVRDSKRSDLHEDMSI
jgi:hypothetical protein